MSKASGTTPEQSSGRQDMGDEVLS
jgi:hypothetical protein